MKRTQLPRVDRAARSPYNHPSLLLMPISALIVDDEQLARDELKYLLDSMGDVNIVALGANGIEAVDLIERHHPDLVFLDVQMPGLDGFAVIERLMEHKRTKGAAGKEHHAMPQVVFATAYDQYAVRAFDVNAVDYLLKPFDRDRVFQTVERARNRLAGNAGGTQMESQLGEVLRLLNRPQGAERAHAPAKLIVQAQTRLLLVDQSEICFAAVDDGIIRVVTQSFEGHSKCRTLEELQELLDPAHFWRAHRGFLVNIDQIREVVPWFKSSYQLRMNDKQRTEIPVSRAQTKRLRELFNL
ncbi:MAG TPA: LytTR family DNA-binding domain-containing protein [Terracidiphilus sp.]|nr:LytTR family DNA-binding domain-containing protein [Terracidiphilus sp.]